MLRLFAAYYDDPAKRALMKPEAQFEVENGRKLSAYDLYDADVVRTAWYQAVRAFFERYDYWLMPASQVFPFDASIDWPKQINGKVMDTYHRWMELMIPVTMASCPALSVPVGFSASGLPMGLQIAGPNHGELACLQLAHAYDEATRWVTKRPPALRPGVQTRPTSGTLPVRRGLPAATPGMWPMRRSPGPELRR